MVIVQSLEMFNLILFLCFSKRPLNEELCYPQMILVEENVKRGEISSQITNNARSETDWIMKSEDTRTDIGVTMN